MRSTLSTFNEVWQRQFRLSLLKQSQQFAAPQSYLIACSGGMDSILLLHVFSALFPKSIRVIYIDHQLQSMSADWGNFVQNHAQQLNVPCIVRKVEVQTGNLEQQARKARYQAFAEHLQGQEILVLAHHQQDQAETLLLRLLSGAGVDGLSAMRVVDVRDEMTIWRPFLNLSRKRIASWVEQLGLEFIIDSTNTDTQYDRAWAREVLWPVLEHRFPQMQQAITRSSFLMQDAQEILQHVVLEDWAQCGDSKHLSCSKIESLSPARQRQLLSVWMKGSADYRPSFEMVERIQHEVIHSKIDAQAALHWHRYYFVRYHDHIYRLEEHEYCGNAGQSELLETSQVFQLGQNLTLASGMFTITEHAIGLSRTLLGKELYLLQRRGGEKIHLYGRVGHWPLKKAIQQAQIFPWLRHTIQILVLDNVMLGVFTPTGFWLAQSAYCEVDGWQPTLMNVSNVVSSEQKYDNNSES